MKPRKCYRAWRQAVLTCMDRWPVLWKGCRNRATAEQVHDLRVVLRRLRLLLAVGKGLVDEKSRVAFRAWARHTCTSASALRDADVIEAWLRQSEDGLVLAARWQRRRGASVHRWQSKHRVAPRGLSRQLLAEPTVKQIKRLARRAERIVQAGRDAYAISAKRYWSLAQEEQHQVRRHLRRWRYLLEWNRGWQRPGDPSLKQILRLQELMGDRGNLQLVHTWSQRTRITAHGPLRAKLAAERKQLDEKLRRHLKDLTPAT